MDLLLALLIVAGLRHPAPAVHYQAPVKTLPLVVQDVPTVLDTWTWGA